MTVMTILRWQWEGYPRYHQSRWNLLLHIIFVPVFLLGNIVLVLGLAQLSWLPVLVGAAAMGLSMFLQGRGHELELVPAEPFTGALNAVLRILLEQWITFPRFVLSGGWSRAIRKARG